MQVANPSGHQHQVPRLNRWVQMALLSGLCLSMTLMAVGALLFFVHNNADGSTALPMGAVLPGILAGNPLAYMVLGLLILMVTPALRICVAALGYMLEGQWGFALISAGVFAVLVVSLFIGAA